MCGRVVGDELDAGEAPAARRIPPAFVHQPRPGPRDDPSARPVRAAHARRWGADDAAATDRHLLPAVVEQLHRNATVEQAGEVRIFPATATVGESSLDAYAAAQEWLSRRS